VSGSPVDVFEYLDYRAFLRDIYLAKKAERRGFSFRAFSRRANLRSPNYLKLVMDGERNLSRAMAERFAGSTTRPAPTSWTWSRSTRRGP
jgi:uncharacterized protein (TIGR02147 family)